jgi:hypothetical protein
MPRLGRLITLDRAAITLAATALFVLAVIGPRAAAAKQARKCENPSLLPADEKRLIFAARGVLPPDLDPLVSGQCRWADGALAMITTEKVDEDNGVTHWWVSSCLRDARRWTCRPAEFRQETVTQVAVGGMSRRVKISFDGETSLEEARTLASQALTILANPTPLPLPYCWDIKGQEAKWQVFRERHPLPTGDEETHITVGLDGLDRQTERVWLGDLLPPDDFQIAIDYPISDGSQTARCWSVVMS